jgi:hypothetical protein
VDFGDFGDFRDFRDFVATMLLCRIRMIA